MTDSLPQLVRDRWATLLTDEAFVIADEDQHRVVLDSTSLRIVVVHDPRGEVDVAVFPRGQEPWQGWSYTGMVGTASVSRLLELALERMRAEPPVLRGDCASYAALAEQASDNAEAWTAYYSGRGPRPGRRHPLP